jgi:hypothetical protein
VLPSNYTLGIDLISWWGRPGAVEHFVNQINDSWSDHSGINALKLNTFWHNKRDALSGLEWRPGGAWSAWCCFFSSKSQCWRYKIWFSIIPFHYHFITYIIMIIPLRVSPSTWQYST